MDIYIRREGREGGRFLDKKLTERGWGWAARENPILPPPPPPRHQFHPQSNIDKMANGVPLTDSDRWDWLTLLREEALRQLSAAGAEGVVLTCSALKRKYRDVIRVAPYYSHDVLLHFIYLHAPEEVLLDRVGRRQGHYMGANMVHSQISILEPPAPDETDVISIDVSGPPDGVLEEALDRASKKIAEATATAVTTTAAAAAQD